MTDYVWPSGLRMSEVVWRHISNSESTPAIFTGSMQTASRPGDRMGCSVRVQNANGAERARLRSLIASLRGRANRIFLPDLTSRRRGAFAPGEIFTNYEFASGTSPWVTDGTITAIDGILRMAAASSASPPDLYQSVAGTRHVPHCLRSFIRDGAGSSGLSLGQQLTAAGAGNVTGTFTDRGYKLVSGVLADAAAQQQFPMYFSASSGYSGGAFADLLFTSLSRCLLADSPANLLQQSDTMSTAPWSPSGCTIGANAATAPDGTSTAEDIVESNSSNVEHYDQQNFTVMSSATDVMVSIALSPNFRSWGIVRVFENAGSTAAYAFFNLSTGELGTVSASGNWTNARAFIKPLGNGWYQCTLIARKTNAATSASALISSATADVSFSYAGAAATSAIRMWRATANYSSSPTQMKQSVGSAVAATTQNGASGFYVKGGRTPTEGALPSAILEGEVIEIDKQIVVVTAPLDLDAAGNGFLQFSPPLARSVADDTPVILNRPMGKFILAADAEYPSRPGDVSDFQLDFVQDLAA